MRAISDERSERFCRTGKGMVAIKLADGLCRRPPHFEQIRMEGEASGHLHEVFVIVVKPGCVQRTHDGKNLLARFDMNTGIIFRWPLLRLGLSGAVATVQMAPAMAANTKTFCEHLRIDC